MMGVGHTFHGLLDMHTQTVMMEAFCACVACQVEHGTVAINIPLSGSLYILYSKLQLM